MFSKKNGCTANPMHCGSRMKRKSQPTRKGDWLSCNFRLARAAGFEPATN